MATTGRGARVGADNCFKCFKYGENTEATAYLKLATSRGPATVYSALYATIALGTMATLVEDCDGNIFNGGLKSSSAISATIFIDGIVTAILAPLSGVIADGTPHRKLMYVFFHALWLGMVVLQMFLVIDKDGFNDGTLIVYMFSLILISVALEISITLINAYLPEITDGDDDVTKLNARTFGFINGFQLLLAVLVTGAGVAFGIEDGFDLAQIAGAIIIAIWIYLSIPGLYGLQKRHKDRIESTGKCTRMSKLCKTLSDTVFVYPQVGIFLATYTFFFAAVGSVVGLATQFLLAGVGLSGLQVSIASALLLLSSVPGAFLIVPLFERTSLKSSYVACMVFWVVISTIGPFVMRGEKKGAESIDLDDIFNPNNCTIDQVQEVVEPAEGAFIIVCLFGILYGIGIGTAFPIAQSIMVVIIPGGEEASYFGLKSVSAKLLSWAPALCFLSVNEALDDRIDLAFLTIAPFFLTAIIISCFLDVEQGKRDVEHTMHLRHGAGDKNTAKVDIKHDSGASL